MQYPQFTDWNIARKIGLLPASSSASMSLEEWFQTVQGSGGAAQVGFLQSGTGATARNAQQELRETITPFQFGGAGDGVTNDSAPVLAASVAAVAQGKDVDFGGHTWLLGTQMALTSSHSNLHWRLRGATIKKGFNGDLITVTSCPNFTIDGVGTLDGQNGTYTGKGVVFSGSSSTSPYFAPGITFTSFADAHISYGADSGMYAKMYCNFLPGTGQTEYLAVQVSSADTQARFRLLSGSTANLGYHDVSGALDFYIVGSAFKRVITTSASIFVCTGSVWANIGGAMTISCASSLITGCRFAGNVTLDSNFGGAFVGNIQTQGTFTDNTAAGNALVLHKDITAIDIHLGKQTSYFPSGSERIVSSRIANVGDGDLTLTVGSSAPVCIFSLTTVARTVTLSTTGAVAGDRFRVVNQGTSNVAVGGLKTLTGGANGWCDVEYNGSAWALTAAGTL